MTISTISSFHQVRGGLYGLDNSEMGAAAAQVVIHGGDDLVLGRLRIFS